MTIFLSKLIQPISDTSKHRALSWYYIVTTATVLALVAQLLVPLLPAPLAPLAQAATFDVDRFDDTAAATACTAAPNDCSLRGAIIAANGNGQDDVINLPEGIYALTINNGGNTENASATGDLDINSNITLIGQGNGAIINAGGLANTNNRDHRVVHVLGGNVRLENITLQGGKATGGGAGNDFTKGGGLRIETGATVFLVDVNISGNLAGTFGGGILNRGTLDLNRVTINNNDSNVGSGGGIRNENAGTVTGTNVTISDNHANNAGGAGGAIRNTDAGSTVSLNFATIAFNTATTNGSAIHDTAGPNSVTLANSIIFNNTGATDCSAAINNAGNNLIDEVSCGIGTATPNILLDPTIQNNGGSTLTHALLPGSAAIDAVIAVCTIVEDQRKITRPFNVPGVGGGTQCDIGAYELDRIPAITINDLNTPEGDAGSTDMVFNVQLSEPIAITVTVNYAIGGGTATGGGVDYTAVTPGTVTFLPGQTTQPITVTVVGDTAAEPDETFNITLTNPVWATLADDTGVGTIVNDDAQPIVPGITIDDPAAVTEGNTGTVNVNFTVSLTATSAATVTVDYATANGTATAPADYVAANGTLTFPPGTNSQNVTVTVNGDTLAEGNENFFVDLSNAGGGTIIKPRGTATITDDDAPLPTISIANQTVTEGNSGTVTIQFQVRLSQASTLPVTVNFATGGGTAVPNQDYVPVSGSITFNPGETVKTINVTVNSNTTVQGDRTFGVTLSNPTNATLAPGQSQATGTIVDDDATSGSPTKGDNQGDDDDDDDGGSSPAPPPPAAPAAPAASAPAPAADQSAAPLPVSTLPETGLGAPPTAPVWPVVTLLGVTAAIGLAWVVRRRHYKQ